MVLPEKVAALTDSPIIAIGVNYDDNGDIEESKDFKAWWFPNYMVVDEFKSLLKDKSLVFDSAD